MTHFSAVFNSYWTISYSLFTLYKKMIWKNLITSLNDDFLTNFSAFGLAVVDWASNYFVAVANQSFASVATDLASNPQSHRWLFWQIFDDHQLILENSVIIPKKHGHSPRLRSLVVYRYQLEVRSLKSRTPISQNTNFKV